MPLKPPVGGLDRFALNPVESLPPAQPTQPNYQVTPRQAPAVKPPPPNGIPPAFLKKIGSDNALFKPQAVVWAWTQGIRDPAQIQAKAEEMALTAAKEQYEALPEAEKKQWEEGYQHDNPNFPGTPDFAEQENKYHAEQGTAQD